MTPGLGIRDSGLGIRILGFGEFGEFRDFEVR